MECLVVEAFCVCSSSVKSFFFSLEYYFNCSHDGWSEIALWYRSSGTEEIVSDYVRPALRCYKIMIAFLSSKIRGSRKQENCLRIICTLNIQGIKVLHQSL